MAYKKYKKLYIRGGASAGARVGGIILRSPVVKRTGSKLASLAKSAAMAAGAWAVNRYGPRVKVNATRALDKFVGKVLNGNSPVNNSPMIIPGVGVLPSYKTNYGKITSTGTGISKSSFEYVCGTPNEEWISQGQKYIQRVMETASCIKMLSTAPLNDVKQYVYTPTTFYSGVIQGLMFAGDSGTTSTTSGYLRAVGNGCDVYLHSHSANIRITSSTNINFMLRIYDLSAKITSKQTNAVTPIASWQNGIDLMFGNNSATTHLNDGVYPGHSKYFRDTWNVDKMTDVTFAAGGSHIHTIERKIQKVYPQWLLTQNDSGQIQAGLTYATMFVLIPTPVHDITFEDQVSIGVGSCDIVISHTLEFYGKVAKYPVFNNTSATGTVTTQEVVADTDFVETAVVN